MSSSIIKNHDHSLEIVFNPNPPNIFSSVGDIYTFEFNSSNIFDDKEIGLLKLNNYIDGIYIEDYLGTLNVSAYDNKIVIENVQNNILPETDLLNLKLRFSNHQNVLLNDYFDIQLVSKTTSALNTNNFDYTYTIPVDFDSPINISNCNVILANSDFDEEEFNFKKEFKWSQDNINWTDNKDLDKLYEHFNKCDDVCDDCDIYSIDPSEFFYLKIIYTRIGNNNTRSLVINSLIIKGEYKVKIQRLGELAVINERGECTELIQTDIYKVFNITGFTIDSSPEDLNSINVKIRFSISQDNCRSWSDWYVLTEDVISKYIVDPLRFFHIKYSICLPDDYDERNGDVKIYDIILEGDFQNVSVDYVNGGKLGLRPEVANRPAQQGISLHNGGANYCQTIDNKSVSSTTLGSNNGSMEISSFDPGKLWNPYETQVSNDLYNNLSNIVSQMFGFTVTYFPVNPDEKGIDRVIHEYQLMNVDECGDVKVLVPENQFPDNQIKFTSFNLELFETFEIHITKDAFKSIFGIERRPMKRDFLFFPEINRMFEIEHAQANRDFLNSSTYYRVTLKKYNKKANVKMSKPVEQAVDSLTNNNSLDSLFGIEKSKEDKITNKDQYQTLSDDLIRLNINPKVNIIEESLYNSSLVVSKNYYDFNDLKAGDDAVTYTKADRKLDKGENRAFQAWFNISKLDHIDILEYSILDNYDYVNNKGYKIWYFDKKIYFKLNSNIYELPVLTIQENVWYCLLINLNQFTQKLDIYILKRFTTIDTLGIETDATELKSSKLDTLWHKEFNLDPVEFLVEDLSVTIKASYLKMTNIRLYNEVVELDSFTKVLNRYIIRKSNYLIFADNANEKIELRNHA